VHIRLFLAFAAIAAASLVVPATAAPVASISASSLIRPGDQILGNPNGQITIVDFYDTSCMPCRAMNRRIERLIAHDPEIRYVPVDLPILGAQSVLGARALVAAGMQGKSSAMQGLLMRQTRLPTMAVLRADATTIGLNVARFEQDLVSPGVARVVDGNLRRGAALGIHYVPVVYVGRNRIPGSVNYHDLQWLVRHAHQRLVTWVAPGHSPS